MEQELARSDGGARGSPRPRQLRIVPVPYPDWLPDWYVNMLALSGLVACLLVGMWDTDTPREVAAKLGHAPTSQFLNELGTAIRTHEAWPLFLWFCVVVLTLEFYILRKNRARQRWIAAVLVLTLGCIVLVALMHIPAFANDPIGWIKSRLGLFSHKFSEGEYAAFNTVVNFSLILLLTFEVVRHWVLRMRAETWNPHAGIPLEGESSTAGAPIAPVVRPRWQELISVDFLAAGILIAVLAGVYYALWQAAQVPKCALALPVSGCSDKNPAFTDLFTLSFLDLLLALCCFVGGVVALTMAAVARAVEAVGREGATTGGVIRASQEPFDVFDSMPAVVLPPPRQSAGTAPYVMLLLRHFIWPVVILFAVAAVSVASSIVQFYLALLDFQHRSGSLFDGDWRNVVVLLLPLAFVAVAALAVVLACATLVFSRTIFGSWLPRLGQVAVLVLTIFWGFALALFIANGIVWLIAAARPHTGSPPVPFMPPALGFYISALAFLVSWLALRRRPPGASASVPREPVPVPARPGTTA